MKTSSISVVISNGSKKFHLAPLASEMARVNVLVGFLTAGWPSSAVEWIIKRLPRSRRLNRLLDRKEEIPRSLVFANNFAELFIVLGDLLCSYSQSLQQKIHGIAFFIYAFRAKLVLFKTRPNIYHYRNCYGRSSVKFAQKLGAKTLCDHSIAHPIFLSYMVSNQGKYPSEKEMEGLKSELMPLEKMMLQDLEHQDHILVNSDFVKETCIQAGMNCNKIHVVYLGVDDAFFRELENGQINRHLPSSNKLLFAGGWQFRKGIKTLVQALEKTTIPWSLEIAGGMDHDVLKDENLANFMALDVVNYLGIVPRSKLALIMKQHRIFVFPSYCEGSARVIFEAMAAGCYVITTKNSGAIVVNDIHGKIVPVGDFSALKNAVEYALSNPLEIAQIGDNNAALIRSHYRQNHYRDNVLKVYKNICDM